jgi:hypothetical protein
MALAVGATLVFCAGSAVASIPDVETPIAGSAMDRSHPSTRVETESTRLETLWIFDADFSTTTGDDAWTSTDRSGTLGMDNYWHHDTIRMAGFPHLGDSTWWCGTNNPCWRQDRGYGNDWTQVLERHFDETTGATTAVILEFDQRYAMENDYDYAYVDVRSAATSDTFLAVHFQANPGFAGTPGTSQDWNGTNPEGQGHMVLDIGAYTIGQEFDLRFRFESDGAYSSQDQWNNPPFNSCLDGAWQLDNIEVFVDGGATPVFSDDAESGDPWTHTDMPASGQTGVAFWRGRFGLDFVTGREFTCDDRPVGSWMFAAVDPFTSKLVDDQWTWLMSPSIDVSGAQKLVGQWDMWLDMPQTSGDGFDLFLASNDLEECVTDPDGFADEDPGWWYGGPFWFNRTDDWDAFAGNDWLAIVWDVRQRLDPTPPHMAGIFVNRTRVGIPSGDAGTQFDLDTWSRYNDWYQEQMADALIDTGRLLIADDDDIVEAFVVASNDAGQTWESYPCRRENVESNWWWTPPPVNQMVVGSRIIYYFTATDGVGNIATYPEEAPALIFEFSILPINGSIGDPGILLVDKHGRRTPGEDRDYLHTSEYYYREMLGILGYEWDVYDVEVPSGTNEQSYGPDSVAFKYYDTQVWFTNEFNSYTIEHFDQQNLINWLQQSGEGKERNLVLTGNDIGYELMMAGTETLSFYETWLATSFLSDGVGSVLVDSVPGVRDNSGGHDFMTHDDGECVLTGGCPSINYFDVIEPRAGVSGTETVADYVKMDSSTRPAGVAYTHSTLGYQTVNLGFGMEFMMDGMQTSRTPGYFNTGIEDRVDLMGNIMDYFGKVPTGPGTGVVNGVRNELSHAYPNPFNPVTKIAYSVKEAGPVTIEVYNVAGRVVRTLLDTEADAGASGYVVWDGTSDGGDRCASGVYFYRIAAPGFTTSRKMVMLK